MKINKKIKIAFLSTVALLISVFLSHAVEIPVFQGAVIANPSESSAINKNDMNEELFNAIDVIELHEGTPVVVVSAFASQSSAEQFVEINNSKQTATEPLFKKNNSKQVIHNYKNIAELDYVRTSQIEDKNDLPGYKNPLHRRRN